MPSKRKSKRKKSRNAGRSPEPRRPERLQMLSVSSPLAEMSDADRAEVAAAIAESAEAQLRRSFGRLRQGITNYEPLALLSHLSFFHLFSDDGTEQAGWDDRFIRQPHVELLQALVLQHHRDAFPWMPTFPDLDAFLDDLDNAHQSFMLYRMALKDTAQAQALLRTQELMRGATQVVRNWGYPYQIQRTVHDLFQPLDDRIQAELGVKPTRLFGMFMRIISTVEERHRRRLAQWRPFLAAKTRKQSIAPTISSFPKVEVVGMLLSECSRSYIRMRLCIKSRASCCSTRACSWIKFSRFPSMSSWRCTARKWNAPTSSPCWIG